MVEIEFTDGTVQRVERCLALLGPGATLETIEWYVAQRKPGAPLRWIKPEEVSSIRVEDEGLAEDPDSPPIPPSGRRMAIPKAA